MKVYPVSMIGTIQRAKRESAICPAPEYIGKPYRPGSGTEGMAFDDAWCAHCTRDAKFREDDHADGALGCKIIADAFAYDITDPNYPKEWVYGRDGVPKCTAYTEDPTCPVRCDKTLDMFAPTGEQTP